MRTSFLPSSDAGLLAWSLNLKTKITATPTAYGLTASDATSYGTVHDAYAAALTTSTDPSTRTKSSVAAKNQARANLKIQARAVAKRVEGDLNVTASQKIDLGLNVRATPAPIPPPDSAPRLDVVSVVGRAVTIKLHDAAVGSRRGRPPGVAGASVFSYDGVAPPPTSIEAWTFQGSTSQVQTVVHFPATLAPGATVYLIAFWYNPRSQSGPPCAPVSVTFGAADVSTSAG